MKRTHRRAALPLCGSALVALSVYLPLQPAAAEPVTDGAGTVGTAVYVMIRKSFTATTDQDQCVGVSSLAAVQRGGSVVLSEGSVSSGTRKVAVGELFRSRMRDGMCEALYIVSAPVMPVFNVQFFAPDGQQSPTFGPIASEPVTDQPGILQAVQVDMQFEPLP